MIELWFLVGTICSALTVPFIKLYIETNNYLWVGIAYLVELVLVYIYSILLHNYDMTIVYPMMKQSSILIVVFIGYMIFDSKFNVEKIIGIILSIVSIYLLSYKNI